MSRRNLIVLMIGLSLMLIIGSSYAFFKIEVGNKKYVMNVGTLQVTFDKEKENKLSLENAIPMEDIDGKNQNDEIIFTVKNTGTVGSYYDIYLEETSTNPEFKSVIKYISNRDDKGYIEPKVLSEDKYIEAGGYIEPQQSSTYKLKIWLDSSADNTYMNKEFEAKLVVDSYQESNYAKDVIKSNLVKYEESSKDTFTGGLVAVNTSGNLYNETDGNQTIREYRYSGLTVNNYVTFNNETWRIIGVFKDEFDQDLVKIVRNEGLPASVMPDTYEVNGVVYNIRNANPNTYAYWNNIVDDSYHYGNNWANAGIMQWLNSKGTEDGYLKILTSENQDMIAETKYYLGAVTWKRDAADNNNDGIADTPKETYINERAVAGCEDNKGPTNNTTPSVIEENNTCRVWANNAATWEGKIALMYLSDYGFSTNSNSNYWDTKMRYKDFKGDASNSSWLEKGANHLTNEWLLSPSSYARVDVANWGPGGGWGGSGEYYPLPIRPTLYLKTNVKIIDGDGSINNQYKLSIE